jgi:putative ABC transport system permease protein
MLKNYIKVAIRNLLRYKIYSIINILGLALGITSTILLALFVQNELTYDNYYPESKNMYRVTSELKMGNKEYNLAIVAPVLAQVALAEIPEIKKTARFRVAGNYIVKYNNISFDENKICFADNSVIDLFAINLLSGSPQTALVEPSSIILSEKTAEKYFNNENPIGKTLTLDNSSDFMVTGVFKSIPQNTHFDIDFMISMPSLAESKQLSWLQNNYQTYFILKDGADPKVVKAKLDGMLVKYRGPEMEKALGVTFAQLEENGGIGAYFLQPVRDIHLYSDLQAEIGVNGDIKYVYIFSIIAAFILLIACVNFMNISTARSATRAKEVGIRKVLGSYKKGLVWQFLTESFLTTLISLIIAIGLIELLMPYFNNLIEKQLTLEYFNNPFILYSIFSVLIVIGFLAGSYPAFVLSSFKPAEVLKGKVKAGTKSGNLRSSLVIFQFTASIILIISTLVVLNQLNYIQNKNLGFNKENVITLNNTNLLGKSDQLFKEKMLQYPEVKSATVSGYLPVPSGYNQTMMWPQGKTDNGSSIPRWDVDHDYLSTMGIKIVEGRDFSREFSTDSTGLILNQAAVKLFGFDNPIGKIISRQYNNAGDFTNHTVIGVVKDFHFQTLRNSIAPLAIFFGNSNSIISFRTNTADISSVIKKLKVTWNEMAPGQPFSYSFLDERFENMYRGEQRISEIFGTFAFLAIFIGCLGLFSLSAFITEQKTKEIGIRKVLGSSSTLIVTMLSKEFVKLVVIAFIIASPIAYYLMNKWLMEFEYKTDLSLWIFLSAGLISLAIAVATVSYQAVKAAIANPVDSLRSE